MIVTVTAVVTVTYVAANPVSAVRGSSVGGHSAAAPALVLLFHLVVVERYHAAGSVVVSGCLHALTALLVADGDVLVPNVQSQRYAYVAVVNNCVVIHAVYSSSIVMQKLIRKLLFCCHLNFQSRLIIYFSAINGGIGARTSDIHRTMQLIMVVCGWLDILGREVWDC